MFQLSFVSLFLNCFQAFHKWEQLPRPAVQCFTPNWGGDPVAFCDHDIMVDKIVLHLFAKSCQTSVLSIGPTWPWWKYFKGDVWPYLITLRFAVAVPLTHHQNLVCLHWTNPAGMCMFLSLLWALLGWRIFMVGPETLRCVSAHMLPQMDFLICGWQLDFEKWRQSWCGSCTLALLHSYSSWCLEKPHRLLWKHQFLYWQK